MIHVGVVSDTNILYETPTRVFVALPLSSTSVLFCDYLFQDEMAGDSAKRFKELLGVHVQESDIDTSVERIPG